MAEMDPLDALAAYSFHFEIDGIVAATFREVSGLSMELSVITLDEVSADGKKITKKMPGYATWGDVTCKRGKTKDNSWFTWIQSIHAGNIVEGRRNASIVQRDYSGAESVRYNLFNCWPIKVSLTGLKADGNEAVIEEAVLVHEGFEIA